MKRLSLPIVALVAAVWFSGCARYRPKPISAEAVAADFSRRTLAEAGVKAFLETNLHSQLDDWPLPSWDFTNLVLAAFYYHSDLDVARAQWAVADAAKISAGERPNPTLNLTPGYDTTTSMPSPWIPLSFLDVPIETAGKRGHRIVKATHLSEAARLAIVSVAWQVRSRVRSSLVGLDAAREAEALLEEQRTLQAENLRLLARQYQAGVISAFELTQARIAADSTQLALRDAERQSAEARVQLADAVGVPTSALDGIEISFAELDAAPDDASLAEARRQALLRRADILAALADYAASQAALQLEIAKQFPDIHLGPGYQYDQGDNKWSLGLTVTLPVLNQNQGAIAEAEAQRVESAARFNALQARVLAAIVLAVAGYRFGRQKQVDADRLLVDLRRQEETARAMLDAGEISKGELIALRLQLSASALARLDALVKVQQVLGALEDALQCPLNLPATVWQASPRMSAAPNGSEQP